MERNTHSRHTTVPNLLTWSETPPSTNSACHSRKPHPRILEREGEIKESMERSAPVRQPRASTSDLLSWSDSPSPQNSATTASAPRYHQPSDRMGNVLFGGQVTEEEAKSLARRKPCSDNKLKEMTGSGIFEPNDKGWASESDATNTSIKNGLRMSQQTQNGNSKNSPRTEEKISLKETSPPEVGKQHEKSAEAKTDVEIKIKPKKQMSEAKSKELSGHDIFGPSPETEPRSLPAACSQEESKESKGMGEPVRRNVHTSVKVSNPSGGQSSIWFGDEPNIKTRKRTAKKIPNQKFAELSGNDIFKGDAPPASVERKLSRAKQKEISGSDIFAADLKVETRGRYGGVRKPPGGQSSITFGDGM